MAYEVHLKEFDGPLDLLLHLIEQAKVNIKDIFISEITNQYLSLMEELDELDMDTASEFLTMAATLVYIKSRSLLPKPPKEAEEEGFKELAEKFRAVGRIEKTHEERYHTLLNNVEMNAVFEKAGERMWECRNCGHLVVGTKAPEVCPVCKHPQAFFEVRAENY